MAAQGAAMRPFQVVVWGASGFTGKLVCEHLARDYHPKVRWAMAGRDKAKLEKVREELTRINPAMADVPILVADAADTKALGSVMAKTQVVLALVGPFAKYGDPVVAQAVANGTHYCDITGEITWVKRSMLKNDAAARAAGVKIVHCCGYDSVPSDLSALMMAEYAERVLGKKLDKVDMLVSKGKGGVSGGTIASAMNIMATEKWSELMALGSDQYYLASLARPERGSDRPAPNVPLYIPEAKTWGAPWVMEGCNSKIVHLSNALRPKGPYGPDFKYLEMIDAGQGWKGWSQAVAVAFGTALIGVALALSLTRSLLKMVVPAPGQGPSLELQRTGFWTHNIIAITHEPSGAAPTVLTGVCGDARDAGYWSTSRMILETGLALVLDADKINASGTCLPGGVITPATAAGMVLVERLRAAGFTWKVDGDKAGASARVPGAKEPAAVA